MPSVNPSSLLRNSGSTLAPSGVPDNFTRSRFSRRPLLWWRIMEPLQCHGNFCYRSYLAIYRTPIEALALSVFPRGVEAKRVEWLQGLSRLASGHERGARGDEDSLPPPDMLAFIKEPGKMQDGRSRTEDNNHDSRGCEGSHKCSGRERAGTLVRNT